MEKLFRIRLKNGNFKDFTDENEANAYEAEIKLKEQQEIERQKKAEEERKKQEELDNKHLSVINDTYNTLSNLVKEYEKKSGKKLIAKYSLNDKDYKIVPTRYILDFAWDQHPLSAILSTLFNEN